MQPTHDPYRPSVMQEARARREPQPAPQAPPRLTPMLHGGASNPLIVPALVVLILGLMIAILVVLGPPPPLPEASDCRPTITQPARGARITLVARVQGCPDLVIVVGPAPGTLLAAPRRSLVGIDDAEIDALPEQPRGR